MSDHHILALAKITSNWKLSNYLNNQTIPLSSAHLGKLTVYWLVKKYPTFCGKQRFTTILTTVCLSLIQFILYLHTSLISVLILFSHLSPSVLFLSVFSTKTLTCHMLRPTHLRFKNANNGKDNKTWSSSGCSVLQSPITMPIYLPQNVLCSVYSVLKSLCRRTHWEENGQPSWQDLRSPAQLWCPRRCIRGWD